MGFRDHAVPYCARLVLASSWSKISRPVALVVLLSICLYSFNTAAQNRSILNDYDTQMPRTDHIGVLGDGLFGDKTDFYTGQTDFLVTDVSLPGNSDLPVALQRRLMAYDDGLYNWFEWSRYEVSYLTGIFAINGEWAAVGPNSGARCSTVAAPPEVDNTDGKEDTFFPEEYWHGTRLYLPGSGTSLMQGIVQADTNKPTDGKQYKWVTKDRWYFSCLPNTKNGAPGEGFLAVSPEGRRYFFDWLTYGPSIAPAIQKPAFDFGTTILQRTELRMLVTRIEDRFGNWVVYNYSGDNDLTSIVASDGRSLTLSYASAGGKLASVSDGARTWSYDYSNGVKLTYPDASVWSAVLSGAGIVRQDTPADCGYTPQPQKYGGAWTLTIEHPSGAIGTFNFQPLRRGLSYVPYTGIPPNDNVCGNPPKIFDNIALMSKAISGPGLPSYVWIFTYGPANDCYIHSGFGYPPPVPCNANSPVTRIVDVAGPNSSFTRYTFGNKAHETDGFLQRAEIGASAASILRTINYNYDSFDPIGYVISSAGGDSLEARKRVQKTRVVLQDGVTFSSSVEGRDVFYQPTSITRASSLGYSRTDLLSYSNNTMLWVLSQLASSTNSNTGLIESQTDYDANALPWKTYAFGKLQQTLTYHVDGTLATATDGNSHTTSFASWSCANLSSRRAARRFTRMTTPAI